MRTPIDLGWCIGLTEKKNEDMSILIASPCDSHENFHKPAQSVKIWGRKNLTILRDALDTILLEETNG